MNTPGLWFLLDYLCLWSAPFQSFSRCRSSRWAQLLGWGCQPAAACCWARYFYIDGNLLVFPAWEKLESFNITMSPFCLKNFKNSFDAHMWIFFYESSYMHSRLSDCHSPINKNNSESVTLAFLGANTNTKTVHQKLWTLTVNKIYDVPPWVQAC